MLFGMLAVCLPGVRESKQLERDANLTELKADIVRLWEAGDELSRLTCYILKSNEEQQITLLRTLTPSTLEAMLRRLENRPSVVRYDVACIRLIGIIKTLLDNPEYGRIIEESSEVKQDKEA